MCVPKLEVAGVVSWFFIGYFLGASLFFLPDTIGRKKSLILGLFFNIIGCYIATFYSSPFMNSIGFFLLGFFHQRIALSFCHATELCADKDKAKIATFLTLVDSG